MQHTSNVTANTIHLFLIFLSNVPFSQRQVRVFDEALSIIAASRVLLGQLFWRSKEDEVALKELEPSCPTLWEYNIAKSSLDSDVSYAYHTAFLNHSNACSSLN